MTRAEILKSYQVDKQGTIQSPGKFEGEPLYLVHFYDVMLDGGGDETFYDELDTPVEVFKITDEDRKEFPEIGDTQVLWLWQTEQGFAERHEFTSEEEAQEKLKEIENDRAYDSNDEE